MDRLTPAFICFFLLAFLAVINIQLCAGTSDPTSFREPDSQMDESAFDLSNIPLGIPDPVNV